MTTLGTKLRKLRDDKKMSQSEIAHILGVSQSAYNKWESDLSKPNIDNLMKISSFHEIDPSELLEDQPSINYSNNEFNDSNVFNHIFNHNQTVNLQSPELLKSVLHNQEQIAKLIEMQTKLIETLLKK